MCGIWGVIQYDPITKDQIKSWQEQFNSIKSRGPDKTNIMHFKNIVYGFHRLAIHDLTPLGDQPFIFFIENKKYLLEVNGEIYNYKELINHYDLSKYLKSDSDCEVIFHLFIKFGSIKKVCLALRGEFSFALTCIDGDKTTTYLARDPFGVRPLFYSISKGFGKFNFSSLLSGVTYPDVIRGIVFPPGYIFTVTRNPLNEHLDILHTEYYSYNYTTLYTSNFENNLLYWNITEKFINAVKIRLDSDRPFGALLSGGLDSSLVCGVISKILGVKNLRTFSIGMQKGTDLEYAQLVATSLGCNHTEVFFTPEQGLEAIDRVLDTTETWDITTIRASVGQMLLGEYISKNTDIKVILNGDGADEVEMGYLYFYLAPNPEEAQKESIKLVQEIHRFDGLRVDRCISTHGLEARLPFLDQDFVDLYMRIDPALKVPTEERMEKQLIRDAFNTLYPGILPTEVLYRKKEAFSDGVSSKEKSWFEIIIEWINTKVTDEEFEMATKTVIYNMCKTKEAYYYRKRFNGRFNKCGYSSNDVIPHYWLPNWIQTNGEPSARILQVYK